MSEINHEIGRAGAGGKLLKTGQTTQYGGYEDDGYFEKGLSKAYTVLTTGQYAGTTTITLNGKTDSHSNNCVYDQKTKLMWSRYASATLGPASDGLLPWTTNGNGEGIFAYTAAANVAKLAGFSDWRVPNKYEIQTLADSEAPTAPPSTIAFPGFTTTTAFWTSTTNTTATTSAVGIAYDSGLPTSGAKTATKLLILVRGGN